MVEVTNSFGQAKLSEEWHDRGVVEGWLEEVNGGLEGLELVPLVWTQHWLESGLVLQEGMDKSWADCWVVWAS